MSDEPDPDKIDDEPEPKKDADDQRVPYERFQQANTKAKEAAAEKAAAIKERDDLRAQLEAAKDAKLPEVDQLKRQLEKAQQDAQTAVTNAVDEAKAQAKAERLVLAAAARAGFDDPEDAFRFPEHVDLSAIEDKDGADRAIKQLSKAKPRLLKDGDETPLPGKVLNNGRSSNGNGNGRQPDIDLDAEAQMVSDNLKKFLASRQQA
jgi:hypothetical protein